MIRGTCSDIFACNLLSSGILLVGYIEINRRVAYGGVLAGSLGPVECIIGPDQQGIDSLTGLVACKAHGDGDPEILRQAGEGYLGDHLPYPFCI